MEKLIIILIIGIIQSGCIGDAYVPTKYYVKNKTGNTIYVKSKRNLRYSEQNIKDSTYITKLPVNSKEIIKIKREICGFGNCKYKISKQINFKDILFFKDSLFTDTIKIELKDWKIKKTKAILKLKN